MTNRWSWQKCWKLLTTATCSSLLWLCLLLQGLCWLEGWAALRSLDAARNLIDLIEPISWNPPNVESCPFIKTCFIYPVWPGPGLALQSVEPWCSQWIMSHTRRATKSTESRNTHHTISKHYLHNMYTLSTQYLHTIYTTHNIYSPFTHYLLTVCTLCTLSTQYLQNIQTNHLHLHLHITQYLHTICTACGGW